MRSPLATLSDADRALLKDRLRKPVLTFLALMGLLAVNVTLGATLPFEQVWALELVVVAAMALVVLLVSMEVLHEPPLVKLFSGLGFFWVAIMVGMTLTDYLGR
ncbi:oxidase [Methylobacterium sp. E-041]|jgi:cytochrome c oxidase subunit 4|uniref:oxidase n=1 Tax=unclassified Methylobacterium TaxID=2615210 RepID=UPI0011CBE223|nr:MULTISPECIES: oxidase [unclassified Methylobacterium]MCJ2006418.1 oxidase [Methylobacterium sp. J-092]MCJ2037812.1 oxidase [Methylobacterium sp. J-059]MCJ2075692.1 oxidase [Methylobacterium sp. E-016]MCJ2105081.1 oxidase [Methylobacterium sp. E-041]TXN69264.1 oxidase [Methylobacterium sp. WL6]